MKTTRLWVLGAAVLVVLLVPAGGRADEAEEKAAKAIEMLRCKVIRNKEAHEERCPSYTNRGIAHRLLGWYD
jgi:hypothetical protein